MAAKRPLENFFKHFFFAGWPRSGHLLIETKPRSGLVSTQVAAERPLAIFLILLFAGLPRSGHLRIFKIYFAAWPRSGHLRIVTKPRSGLVYTWVAAKRPLENFFKHFFMLGGREAATYHIEKEIISHIKKPTA